MSFDAPHGTLNGFQSYSLLKVVVEAMPNAVLLVGHDGAIQIANSRAARLFGYTADQLAGKPLDTLIPERYRARHALNHAQFMLEPGTREMGGGRELFGLRRDGTELPIEVGLDVLRIPEQTFVLASVFDASERRDAVRTAESATALAQSIIDSAPFSIVATDILGFIIEVSPAAEKMFGVDKAKLIGKPAAEHLHDSVDATKRHIQIMNGGIGGACPDARNLSLKCSAGASMRVSGCCIRHMASRFRSTWP